MATNKKISRIKLSNGEEYAIFDRGGLRLNENGVLITGSSIVDKIVLGTSGQGCDIYITEIDDVPITENITNVLVQNTVPGINKGQIMKRSTDVLLQDIGGTGLKMNEDTGTLSLKIGKFDN